MKAIQLNEQGIRILGFTWLILGISLPILYLLPLFGSPILDLNGIDVISAANDLSGDKKISMDKTSGFLMLIVPQFLLFLGFLGFGLGINCLVSKKAVMKFPYMIASAVVILIGLFCIIRMATVDAGFFSMLLPKAQAPFYISLFLLALIALAPLVLAVLYPASKTATPPMMPPPPQAPQQ